MPPKARAPEARMVFGWDQVRELNFAHVSGQADVSPQYAFPGVASFHLIKAELLLPSVQGSDVWN